MILMTIVGIVTLLTGGLLAGIFLGNRMGTSVALPRIPDAAFVQFQQTLHSVYVRLMPPLQILSILGSIAWAWLLCNGACTISFYLVAASALLSVTVFAITLTVNVPINKKLMAWNPSAPPSNARAIWKPWDAGNHARTLLAVTMFILQVVAVILLVPPAH